MAKKKLYRPNVAVVVLAADYEISKKIFIAERSDIQGVWQFPQGGIDKGETSKEAMYRELKEEIGTKKVKLLAKYPEWISYDFPAKVSKRMKPYSGQKQRYYLVRLKKSAKINIDTKDAEFSQFKFVKIDKLFKHITHFKAPIYKEVLEYFKDEGYL
ncbi:MAG: RNA pyrophosphohydrolase [Campylobacterota bacterium]|nr:RNA pyrophosphohydrolase [Campylobacterota bacterium]